MTFEIAIGSNIRKSPYFAATLRAGVRSFSVYNHMYIPAHFGDPDAEYRRLMGGVAMWDVAAQRQVELVGPDAARLAQILTPRNLAGTKVGQGRYVPICDHDGFLINDPVLLKLAENRFWLSVADSDLHLWALAIARERGFDVRVLEPDVSPLAVQGPRAEAVIAALFGDWVRDLRYFWFRETALDGIPLVLARSGWSKQGGFELYLTDSSRGEELWNRVAAAGAPFDIGPGAPNDVERVESGLVSYGSDMRRQVTPADPFEMGLGGLVDFAGGHDFVGRDALTRLAVRGPARRRVGLWVDGAPAAPGNPVRIDLDGAEAGVMSEMVFSQRLARTIGIGLIRADLRDDTSGLTAALPDGPVPVYPAPLPFR
ncbi:glycine cleavage system protein T [Frigidibacter sp. RF13]|uniref:glycine cleavage T C-terminal barrel domain-containing protein n=1 Tax=Frigidibacter sp. RF13 TaxID=2997340 RepID=UPI00226EB961|nr:glycine cleavage T C-terminal barrel domain-containing protein [Frigidibacter sp. RF13]MCY1125897.1 glycine cleavage system protein T [Frigidibacter sp. RF13]